METGRGLGGGRCSGRMIAVVAVAVMAGEEVEGALRGGWSGGRFRGCLVLGEGAAGCW